MNFYRNFCKSLVACGYEYQLRELCTFCDAKGRNIKQKRFFRSVLLLCSFWGQTNARYLGNVY